MTVWLKEGVCGDLTNKAAKGKGRIQRLYEAHDKDLFITCKRDGNHMPGSLHYEGLAFDFQQNGMPMHKIKAALGEGWDVVKSSDGAIHVELDPK